jgi:hypothetical protein
MHKIIAIVLLSFSITIAKADCASSGIWCWPGRTTINRNSIFILTFYGVSQDIVSQIGKPHSIYLKSVKQNIPLIITEINKGEFGLTQVLLKPSSELTGGLEYEILIESLSRYEAIDKWNTETKKLEKARWIVSNTKDTENPKWVELPKLTDKTMVEYGCGPAKWVNFSFRFSDSSDILIKTTVKSLQTQTETTYYLENDGNKIKLGHGMCSGAFHFDKGDNYEVTFALMDQSGKCSIQSSKPVRFSKPLVITQSE